MNIGEEQLSSVFRSHAMERLHGVLGPHVLHQDFTINALKLGQETVMRPSASELSISDS